MDQTVQEWLVRYLKAIVNHPDEVQVAVRRGQMTVVYDVSVNPSDIGRVKGKRGKVIQALNGLIQFAGHKEKLRHVVEVMDAPQEASH
ncbi:MAG: KH domain-containing protein [Acidobacteria bacterium]|nr:KH domain-containing protein [Acidobacteriota bacterium]